MIRSISKLPLLVLLLASCEGPGVAPAEQHNTTLCFRATNADTKGTSSDLAAYFSKLNIMLFDADGNKVFDKVRTQMSGDDDFGSVSLQLAVGTYTVVAVGHSSINSATIKSPQMVQFTASNGEKLTDTFCYCGKIEVGDEPRRHNLTMHRVAAMLRFVFTDTDIPAGFSRLKIDYTGGSANFNPSTMEGTTKSTQSETRQRNDTQTYEVFTFPYLSDAGTLRVTVSALDEQGVVLVQRTFEAITVNRNRITTYAGQFFGGGGGTVTQTGFGFVVDGDWAGEDHFTF